MTKRKPRSQWKKKGPKPKPPGEKLSEHASAFLTVAAMAQIDAEAKARGVERAVIIREVLTHHAEREQIGEPEERFFVLFESGVRILRGSWDEAQRDAREWRDAVRAVRLRVTRYKRRAPKE